MFSCMELNIFILSNCCGNQMKEKPIAIQYQLTYIIWKIIKFNSMLISFTYPLIQQNSILRKQIPRDTEHVKVNFAKYIQQNLKPISWLHVLSMQILICSERIKGCYAWLRSVVRIIIYWIISTKYLQNFNLWYSWTFVWLSLRVTDHGKRCKYDNEKEYLS